MPILSAFFIRTSLIYLALGFTFGALMLANKGVPFGSSIWGLLGSHIEFLMIGWIIQLALGVAYWILPRFSRGPSRGNELLPWLSYVVMNAGIWMDILSPLFREIPWLPALGKMTQTVAGVLFLVHAWPRVRPLGK